MKCIICYIKTLILTPASIITQPLHGEAALSWKAFNATHPRVELRIYNGNDITPSYVQDIRSDASGFIKNFQVSGTCENKIRTYVVRLYEGQRELLAEAAVVAHGAKPGPNENMPDVQYVSAYSQAASTPGILWCTADWETNPRGRPLAENEFIAIRDGLVPA
jgi:hypothetical protein